MRLRRSGSFPFYLFVWLVISGTALGQQKGHMFEKIGSDRTNVHFVNRISDSINITDARKYIYIANSSGTGVADLNNDGKTDIFFSSNTGENKLYINQGDFRFKDVTAAAGITGNGKWGTGVCIADINGDGLLDIFIAHSGNFPDPESLSNEVYLCTVIDGDGVPHYTNKARELGLDVPGSRTTQAVFFDYDRDGDLDCFLLNHSDNTNGDRLIRDNFSRDTSSRFISYNMLLRNDSKSGVQYYTNVSDKAGINNSRRNFGLGVVITDFNDDNWPDIYTSSDFAERDHLYINNHDGTFTETGTTSFRHMSRYSMGVDAADINNDSRADLITLDMLPEDNYHIKLQLPPENTDQFDMMVKMGLSKQYVKNMLQVNIGSDNGVPKFAEVAQMAGVSNTNWSWTPLFYDVNNDGWKDLFISNGYFKDLSDQDVQNQFISTKPEKGTTYGPKKLNSCLFLNDHSFCFTKQENWKADDPEMSYSACIADFNNDGRPDIIINNLNNEVSILRNAIGTPGNYVDVRLRENDRNTFAIGAKVYVTSGDLTQVQEMQNVRGYQSSQDYVLHFGLGPATSGVKIRIVWPDGTESESSSAVNRQVLITKDAKTGPAAIATENTRYRFTPVSNFCRDSVGHAENKFNDFKTQFTLPYRQSALGPGVAQGDINGDGYTDYYIGGATDHERYFLLGKKNGTFQKFMPAAFRSESLYEDVAAVLFDMDKDGDLDLVVVSGSVEFPNNSDFFTDRAYRNDGKGNFEKIENAFPQTGISKRCVAVGDYDNDGRPDLFIGGYTTPGRYEVIPQSFVFRNESGKDGIKFTDVTSAVLPGGPVLGMVSSASWVDIDGDDYPELVADGEWMSCSLFKNKKGILTEDPTSAGMKDRSGLYGVVFPTDYNQDGRIDFIVGNAGDNSQYKASATQPIKLFAVKDSANKIGSGFLVSYYCNGVEAFASSRNEVLQEFVPYKRLFPDYASYGKVDIRGFFEKVGLAMPRPVAQCTDLRSGIYINNGDGSYNFELFPEMLQTSKITCIEELDWNFDGRKDYVISGNFMGYKHQFGPSDAFPAYILQNEGKGKYKLVMPAESGLFVDGQVAKVCVEQRSGKCRLIFVRNNDKILVYENSKK